MADPGPRPTVVVGTAGHIDHGKTSLLRALSGIDADRLPEARRRGMTIDVGYAHLVLPSGTPLDLVDVPGHDRLIGNMLVGAGEIDAALLVIAADDGPRAQTHEHLAILHALGVRDGIVVVTKTDVVDAARVGTVVAEAAALVATGSLAGAPVLAVSSRTGEGVDALRDALDALAARVIARQGSGGGARLAIDRSFTVKGRGTVVTGTLRGGSIEPGAILRVVPGSGSVRVRELQVHGSSVAAAGPGRTAANVAGEAADRDRLIRGVALSADPALVATDRILVALEPPLALATPPVRAGAPAEPAERPSGRARSLPWPPADRTTARLHALTAEAGATIGRAGRDALDLPDGRAVAVVRLDRAIALAPGDRIVLRRPTPGSVVAGGVVLDARPARGVSRARQDALRVARLADAVATGDRTAIASARLALHGIAVADDGRVAIDPAVTSSILGVLAAATAAHHRERPADAGITAAALRSVAVRALRAHATLPAAEAPAAADAVIAAAVAAGTIVRDAERYRLPGHAAAAPDPLLVAAMDRLVAALTGDAPPPLAATARAVRCPPEGIRALERSGRIVVAGDDLAWTADAYRALAARALALSRRGPLTPAAFRDATGTSRKYVLPLLEDLDRRGILRRTDAGHLPGPKAPPPPSR